MTIYTSSEGSGGSKVSVHKSLLLSALTVKMDKSLAGSTTDTTTSGWEQADNSAGQAQMNILDDNATANMGNLCIHGSFRNLRTG